MTKYATITAIAFLALFGTAHAGTYAEAMKTCGAEWRASDARKAVVKGQGRDAWNKFRKECTARVGYTKKAR